MLDDYCRLLIAVQACLPALQQGVTSLHGWREVLIYPGEFNVRRSDHDENTGVVGDGDELMIGEAWERGPLVLSLADVQLDLEQPRDGYNVVVHEMAHKLAMFDGRLTARHGAQASRSNPASRSFSTPAIAWCKRWR